jgi:hypothetical protein
MLVAAPVDFTGGYTRLATQLASTVAGRNSTILWNEPWPDITVRGRRAAGIKTSQGAIETTTIFVNAERMPVEQTLFLGLRRDVIPVRMENTVLCVSDYQKPGEYHALVVTAREGSAPSGMCSLVATFPSAEEPAPERDRLVTRLQSTIPFLRDFIVITAGVDGERRCFPLPDSIAPGRADRHKGRQALYRSQLKNVLVMPDSSRLLNASVQTAMQSAVRLA